MEESKRRLTLRSSLALKLCAIFLALVFGVVILLNIYPVTLARDLVSANKKSSMLAQAAVMSSSLAALEELTGDGVYQAMELLDTATGYRVIVTDSSARILYDNAPSSAVGRYALWSELNLALNRKVVFYSKYADDAFLSRAATPVVYNGGVIGAVFLYEYDSEQSALISGIRDTMFRLSIMLSFFSLVLILFFSRALTRRISDLVAAINIVREGDYDYRIPVVGTDEVSFLTEEFNGMTDQLRETEERRRRFVSDASHELKTPLASIRLLSDSIVQTEGMDSATMREFVTDIGAEAERLQRTTEKLLSLTRLDSSVTPVREKVDIKAVAENTLRLLHPLASGLRIFLKYELSEGCVILANADDIYQIIFNLVENGIKYNVPDGMVNMRLSSTADRICLVVADSGIGIPAEDMPHIFDRFYRVDKARSREHGGSGLGLSIVHTAVEANGGEISVCANEPRGTRFTVIFPKYTGEEEQP
ncbi:MAG: sensor histidine kinase [Candidatus Heteroscillospira sp.]|jgi:signal transduction histidine kinase